MADGTAIGLETREGLPDALRVLVEKLPRGTWEAHPNFSPLTRFWLDRHLMFRDVLGKLRGGSQAFLDGRTAPERYGRETARLAQFFLGELHAHHSIEDHHYFPVLQGLDARLERGFTLLDADHHALDGHLNGLAETTNGMLRGLSSADPKAGAGTLEETLGGFETFLDRHLTDEEDLVVPVILTYAPEIG
ncbi:hemerythrin HHE cation binding domain-containing protein [Palleronia aestuarii]|uniref:Hemerythrin HHE cation binding domain-containing protein n=1 Tax=Palleronia aestuarii TaxID=568105 RepID=A0A2W7NSN8_9RHOB|nr:hemerythrin domain-containing protein [Palleronia aestuarii]PZX16306.1 hemerythrin HHE cation binding domain-containing protein [Palleronia aestuarii]